MPANRREIELGALREQLELPQQGSRSDARCHGIRVSQWVGRVGVARVSN